MLAVTEFNEMMEKSFAEVKNQKHLPSYRISIQQQAQKWRNTPQKVETTNQLYWDPNQTIQNGNSKAREN